MQADAVKKRLLEALPADVEIKTLGYFISPKISEIEQSIGYAKCLIEVRKIIEGL